MDRKLTLSLDKKVIEKAKEFARKHQTSLSRMVESYFESLTSEELDDFEIEVTPLVDSLCGVIELPNDFDYKNRRTEYLTEKHR
ncbi:MAG: hypothetical protein HKN87_09630 [Saprospiraceae bacterium]|nr:hypothetical protein [Saprospiraceae bacterium]